MSDLRFKIQNRVFARFIPEGSISAAILDEDFHIVQGVVSNISETGAALVTNRSVLGGPDIDLRLSQKSKGVMELQAKIVWMAEGVSTSGEVVGSLLGLYFPDQSILHRERIREFCWHSDVFSHDNSARDKAQSQKHFDLLVDPDIEHLCLDEQIDPESLFGKLELTVPDSDFSVESNAFGRASAFRSVGQAMLGNNGSGLELTAKESSPFPPGSWEEEEPPQARDGAPERRERKIRVL